MPIQKFHSKDLILQLQQTDPTFPPIRMAQILGISKQRVNQILIKYGTASRIYRYNICEICGKEHSRQSAFCSTECHDAEFKTIIKCAYCHEEKPILKSELHWRKERNELQYCSYSCRTKHFWQKRKEN